MKKNIIFIFVVLLFAASSPKGYGQNKIFHEIIGRGTQRGMVTSLTEDKLGYIWFGCGTNNGSTGGLYRLMGTNDVVSYLHNPGDSNSLGANWVEALARDSSSVIWIGTYGAGIDRFDPITQTFTHFRHNPDNPSSIAGDTVNALLIDHLGNLWVGTNKGLDKMNRATGQFTHYVTNPADDSSLSDDQVRVIFEDHDGNLWVGCGNPLTLTEETPQSGGLNLFHPATGRFTRYLHDPDNPNSISNNKITAINEDSRGNLWIGTGKNGLQIINRKTGVFTHFPYDPQDPEKLSAPPLYRQADYNMISFIEQDDAGNLWIGTTFNGIEKYNPDTKKVTRFGFMLQGPGKRVVTDTASGFTAGYAWHAFKAKNGLLWIPVGNGRLFYVNPFQKNLPYYFLKQPSANAFYQDDYGGFWIATDSGLLYRPMHGKEKLYTHKQNDPSSLSGNGIGTMLADKKGNLWLGTYPGGNGSRAGGLNKLNPSTGTLTHYTDPGLITGTGISALYLDENGGSLWVGADGGLYELNTQTGKFAHHYLSNPTDSNSLSNNIVYTILGDTNQLWVGTKKGLDLFNQKENQWKHFLQGNTIHGLFKDGAGVLWVGTQNGLYRYGHPGNHFELYSDAATGITMGNVLNVTEDNNQNLWVSCADAIYRISANREKLHRYGPESGVHPNTFLLAVNYRAKDGKLFLGDQGGYYTFYPDSLNNQWMAPALTITSFQLGGKTILPGKNGPLQMPIFQAGDIGLKYNQNSFSFEFSAVDYASQGDISYRYKMEGFDSAWHDIGKQTHAYFFNMPAKRYVFKVRAINANGTWSEKDINVTVNPPWWTTWWGVTICGLLLTILIWAIVYLRSRELRRKNQLLEEKVSHRTAQLKKSLEDLKSTQKQLVQSEKMASLGELTAGIAHEIQNPLNFVNNFSDINKELLEELKGKADNGNIDEVKMIAANVFANEEKINYHGRRADAIVKSMLQHSRTSSGKKELTDINALTDEYLRLSYHGMRAKDKRFNCAMKTEFDRSLEKINVVPQDIGRVLLNLFNNAFYACAEQHRVNNPGELPYVPTVTVVTRKENDKTLIVVKDNGNGIPEKIKNKIFQPFFTTKPTGSGTGLGLSLSYDIITKEHNGKIEVVSREHEGTSFLISLPVV